MTKKFNQDENIPGLGPFWESLIHERYELAKFTFTTGSLVAQRKFKVLLSHRLPKKKILVEISNAGIFGLEQNHYS